MYRKFISILLAITDFILWLIIFSSATGLVISLLFSVLAIFGVNYFEIYNIFFFIGLIVYNFMDLVGAYLLVKRRVAGLAFMFIGALVMVAILYALGIGISSLNLFLPLIVVAIPYMFIAVEMRKMRQVS